MSRKSKYLLLLSIVFIISGFLLEVIYLMHNKQREKSNQSNTPKSVQGVQIKGENNISETDISEKEDIKDIEKFAKYFGKSDVEIVKELGEGNKFVAGNNIVVARKYSEKMYKKDVDFMLALDSEKIVTDVAIIFKEGSLDTWKNKFDSVSGKGKITELKYQATDSSPAFSIFTWKDSKYVYSLKDNEDHFVELTIKSNSGGKNED